MSTREKSIVWRPMNIKSFLENVTTQNLSGNEIPVNVMGLIKRAEFKKRKKKKQILETITPVKFHYTNYKHDKTPKVMVLDFDYEGRPGQKTYGQRKDLLGWNINYFENKEEAVRSINDIDTFAKMLSANKLEKYRRIRYFFPEQYSYIRRYNKEFVKNLKVKNGWFWTRTTIEDLKNKEDF